MKKILTYGTLATISFIINFLIYNFSFNKQATPFLSEEQRLESGIMMLQSTIPAFAIAAVVFAVLYYTLSKKLN